MFGKIEVMIAIPEHFKEMFEERKDEFGRIQQVMLVAAAPLLAKIKQLKLPINQLCGVITWSDASDNGIQAVLLEHEAQQSFLQELKALENMEGSDPRTPKTFEQMLARPAEGMLRMFLMTESGTTMALRMAVTSSGAVGLS